MSAWRVAWVEEAAAWVAEKQETEKASEKGWREEGSMRMIASKGERVEGVRMMERRIVSNAAHFWVHCPPRGGTGLILAAAHTPDKTKRSQAVHFEIPAVKIWLGSSLREP